MDKLRPADAVTRYYKDYIHTENLAKIWGTKVDVQNEKAKQKDEFLDLPLFRQLEHD